MSGCPIHGVQECVSGFLQLHRYLERTEPELTQALGVVVAESGFADVKAELGRAPGQAVRSMQPVSSIQ